MPRVISIAFKEGGKTYDFDPGDLEVDEGQWVIIDTPDGEKCVQVVRGLHDKTEDELATGKLKIVKRQAERADIERTAENQAKEQEAATAANEMIEQKKLKMKLIDIEVPFDRSKITFYFSAEQRVDFRELVKELAGRFKTRIEMKQVSIRDQAKMLGDLGPCGRPLCCVAFKGEGGPVSIRMAKDQKLSLNPQKISGVCGRLMCCLRYEHKIYEDFKKRVPVRGKEINTPEGKGKVLDSCPMRETVKVDLGGGDIRTFTAEELGR